MLSFPISEIRKIIDVVRLIFFKDESSLKQTAENLLDYSESYYKNGIDNADTSKVHPFITDCISTIKEGYSEKDMDAILQQRIESYYDSEMNNAELLNAMSKYPPAFGMVGTVVGLIALMASLGSGNDMSFIGQGMAVALTTTLYGLSISNFIFKPLSDNFQMRAGRNLKTREMIHCVVKVIQEKGSLLVIQDSVNAYLSVADQVNILDKKRGTTMSQHSLKNKRKSSVLIEDKDDWMISYADMVTLLLCFFIVSFVETSPYSHELLQSISDSFSKEEQTLMVGARERAQMLSNLEVEIREKIQTDLNYKKFNSVLSAMKMKYYCD